MASSSAALSSFSGKKIMYLYLDGSTDDKFKIELLGKLSQNAGFNLVQYSWTGGTQKMVGFQFLSARGLDVTPSVSNVLQTDSFAILTPTASGSTELSPGMMIASMQGCEVRNFTLVARDQAGLEHNHTSHRLFDSCCLVFEFIENAQARNPLYLQGVSTIQRTMDTL